MANKSEKIILKIELDSLKGRNRNGRIEGIEKSKFAEAILRLNKKHQDHELTKKYFKKWMDRWTHNCETPEKKAEELRSRISKVGKSLRKSLSNLRKRIFERVYHVYSKSINTANVKKVNSFLLFISNFKHFLKPNRELFEACVNLYAELFDHVDGFTNGKFSANTLFIKQYLIL